MEREWDQCKLKICLELVAGFPVRDCRIQGLGAQGLWGRTCWDTIWGGKNLKEEKETEKKYYEGVLELAFTLPMFIYPEALNFKKTCAKASACLQWEKSRSLTEYKLAYVKVPLNRHVLISGIDIALLNSLWPFIIENSNLMAVAFSQHRVRSLVSDQRLERI